MTLIAKRIVTNVERMVAEQELLKKDLAASHRRCRELQTTIDQQNETIKRLRDARAIAQRRSYSYHGAKP